MGESPPPWGQEPIPPNPNQRRIPEWMDPKGEHGDLKFLLLKPVSPAKLPTYPFIISKSVEQAAGQIVGGNPTDNGNAYLLKVRSERQVEKLLRLDHLIDSTPVSIVPHPFLNTCKCVVTCKEAAGATNEQLVSDLASQGVVNVYRFQRKVNGQDIPTNTMVLTIQGTVVPRHIRFGFIQTQTRPYYPRPMLCLQCGKFRHTKKHCHQDPICMNCGEKEIHSSCDKEPHCVNCQNAHCTNNRNCPAYKEEQENIKISVNGGVSLNDATKEFRNRQTTSSSVQQRLEQIRTNNTLESKDKEIMQLRKQVALLSAQLAMFNRKMEEEMEHEDDDDDEDDSTLDGSASNTSTNTVKSSVSQISTPKRTRKTSSDESPTGNDPSPKPNQKKSRSKKKRQQKFDKQAPQDTESSHSIPPYQPR